MYTIDKILIERYIEAIKVLKEIEHLYDIIICNIDVKEAINKHLYRAEIAELCYSGSAYLSFLHYKRRALGQCITPEDHKYMLEILDKEIEDAEEFIAKYEEILPMLQDLIKKRLNNKE